VAALKPVIIALSSLAAFAGLARPVGPFGGDHLQAQAYAAPGEDAQAKAARRLTVAPRKFAPTLGPAFAQVDARLPDPRAAGDGVSGAASVAQPTTAAASGATTTRSKASNATTATTTLAGASTTKPVTTGAPKPTDPPAAPTTTRPPTTTPAPATTQTPAPPTPSGWQTVFLDDFNSGGVDGGKWTIENRPATNMGEISFYAADDVFVRDGSMILRAQNRPMGGRSYTTGQAVTKFDFQYGRVEIRAKMPTGQGFWPALWMLPTNGHQTGWLPEIDIYESINREGRYFGNYHFPVAGGQSKLGPIPVPTDVTAWHTYGLEWTPDKLSWTLDGNVVISTTNTAATRDKRMFLLITFALGGSWPGNPDHTTPFPSEMQIDYVKVMQQR
jgi:beta-glucanase (GH16 family)